MTKDKDYNGDMNNDDMNNQDMRIILQDIMAWPEPPPTLHARVMQGIDAWEAKNGAVPSPAFLPFSNFMRNPLGRAALLALTVMIGFYAGLQTRPAALPLYNTMAATPLYAGSGMALAQLFSEGNRQ